MVYSLAYRRPVSSKSSITGSEKHGSNDDSIDLGSSGSVSHGIPDALSFNRIIEGGTCPVGPLTYPSSPPSRVDFTQPCTVRDFMNYLKYIEHDAENLQFYLWFRDYKTRFANLPDSEKSLSPEWTNELAHADAAAFRTGSTFNQMTLETAEMMKPFDEEHGNKKYEDGNPFNDSRESTTTDQEVASTDTRAQSVIPSTKSGFSQKAETAFEEAGLKWQPCLTLLVTLPINSSC